MGVCLAGMCAVLLLLNNHRLAQQHKESCRRQQSAGADHRQLECWMVQKLPCCMVLLPELLRCTRGLTVICAGVQDGALAGSHSEALQSAARITGNTL